MINFKIFDLYTIKNLAITTIFIGVTLAAIILLTQSLKFLELIVEAGASSGSFWVLTFLALPRFFEVILPIALMIAGIIVYNRMISDNEIVVARSAGMSTMQVSKPAFILAALISVLILFITAWLAPVSLSKMQEMRQIVKAQYSTLLFQEGVFNEVGKSLTVYIDSRNDKGELEGLLIYDNRSENPAPVTIVAKRGIIVATNDGQQVLVFEGSRQDFNDRTGALNRLDFDRYSIDLPESSSVTKKWKEPDERTFFELLNPNSQSAKDKKFRKEFLVEANRRIAGSLLPLTYISIVLTLLLLGPKNRSGQAPKIIMIVIVSIVMQSLFLSFSSFATKNIIGVFLLYFLVIVPVIVSILLLSNSGSFLKEATSQKKVLRGA